MAKDQQKTQKDQACPAFTELQARDFFEAQRWPNAAACVHCGSVNVYRVGGSNHRPGLLECRDCRDQFTVTVGTVMEDSHLPLSKWAIAFHLMCASKKGVSALQLQRQLGLGSYRTAWHLAHRIREAMRTETMTDLLKGDVQVDETYIGGKPRQEYGKTGTIKAEKAPVVALVETDGRVRSQPLNRVDANTLHAALQQHVQKDATIVTDEARAYLPIVTPFFEGGHQTVNHSKGEYVNPAGYSTNTAESYFALLKRGVHGTFHHVSKKHLGRYCDEFSFRWNGRKLMDVQRRDLAIAGAKGKRLMYRKPIGEV